MWLLELLAFGSRTVFVVKRSCGSCNKDTDEQLEYKMEDCVLRCMLRKCPLLPSMFKTLIFHWTTDNARFLYGQRLMDVVTGEDEEKESSSTLRHIAALIQLTPPEDFKILNECSPCKDTKSALGMLDSMLKRAVWKKLRTQGNHSLQRSVFLPRIP